MAVTVRWLGQVLSMYSTRKIGKVRIWHKYVSEKMDSWE